MAQSKNGLIQYFRRFGLQIVLESLIEYTQPNAPDEEFLLPIQQKLKEALDIYNVLREEFDS